MGSRMRNDTGNRRCHSSDKQPDNTRNNQEFVRVFFNINFGDDKADVLIDNIRLEDNSQSGISTITASDESTERIYTLDGKMLHGQPTQPGIYIVTTGSHGRKVVIQ